ncbi:MAG TPA: hypothetical protein VMS65_17325 [Polyangiaceae bacterium]|nr:hypothetical protein [Polyangiaceae bacterium]
MVKFLIALAFGMATLGTAASAEAQELGTQGDMLFGVERIFGIRGEHVDVERPDPLDDDDISGTTISLGFARALVPYNIPRATFDYFFANHWSVGGAIGYSNMNADNDPGGSLTVTDFVLAPRGGYLHMFGAVAGIWPRAGFTYHSTSLEDFYSEWTFALNIECQFPLIIRQHFGVLVGIAFDQSFMDNRNPENGADQDVTYRSIGAQVALFGWI